MISPEELESMTAKIKTLIIPDPNDKLKIIYEVDKLVNILDIRAEKFYSREWKEELLALEAKWNKDKAENKLSYMIKISNLLHL